MNRQIQSLLIINIVVCLLCTTDLTAYATGYEENLAYYQEQSFVQEYVNHNSPITKSHFTGKEDSQKKAFKSRYIKCYDRLKELGYYVGGRIYSWSQPVLDGISLFAQQSGLGDIPKNEIPLVVEAVLLSSKAQPALIPAINPSDYEVYSIAKLQTSAEDKKIALLGRVEALESIVGSSITYRIEVDGETVIVRYETPKRASTFIVGDKVSVFGSVVYKDGRLEINAELIAFSDGQQ